jgi:hypothetical protein
MRKPAPQPEPTAEPANQSAAGVLSMLAAFSPSPAMAAHSASLGRNTSVMLNHVREHLVDAANALRALGADATAAKDWDSVQAVQAALAVLAEVAGTHHNARPGAKAARPGLAAGNTSGSAAGRRIANVGRPTWRRMATTANTG